MNSKNSMTSKHIKPAVICALLAVVLGVGVILATCQVPKPQPGIAETETLPDLTDEPTMTSVEPYRTAIEAAFADATPVPPDSLTVTETENGVMITGYSGPETVVVLPDTVDGRPVVAIDEKTFENNTSLTALYIPDSVTLIGRSALVGCTSLTALRTPVAVALNTTTGDEGEETYSFGALFGAPDHTANGGRVPASLKTLILGEAVTEIPAYAFFGCNDLVCVAFPDTLTSVGDFAFYGCTSLAYADLSATVLAYVGECAFTDCAALLQFHLPATVTEISVGAVKGCGSLETMELPFVGHTTEESGYLGFLFGAVDYTLTEGHMPISLVSVTLLDGCLTVPDNAFFGCSYLRCVYLPDSIKTVGHRAFYRCERLTALTLPDNVYTVGNEAFAHCVRLQSVSVGNGLTSLGVQAFMRCLSLKTVTLPHGVTEIPASCFAGCISLETVTAPGVTSADKVGAQAYRGCTHLTDAPFRPIETDTESE